MVQITPNPAHDFIQLKFANQLENVNLEISDITGKVCKTFKQVSHNTRLDLDLGSGVYVIRVKYLEQVGYQ